RVSRTRRGSSRALRGAAPRGRGSAPAAGARVQPVRAREGGTAAARGPGAGRALPLAILTLSGVDLPQLRMHRCGQTPATEGGHHVVTQEAVASRLADQPAGPDGGVVLQSARRRAALPE